MLCCLKLGFFKRNLKRLAEIQCWRKLPDWQAWEIIFSLLARKRQLQRHFPWDHCSPWGHWTLLSTWGCSFKATGWGHGASSGRSSQLAPWHWAAVVLQLQGTSKDLQPGCQVRKPCGSRCKGAVSSPGWPSGEPQVLLHGCPQDSKCHPHHLFPTLNPPLAHLQWLKSPALGTSWVSHEQPWQNHWITSRRDVFKMFLKIHYCNEILMSRFELIWGFVF